MTADKETLKQVHKPAQQDTKPARDTRDMPVPNPDGRIDPNEVDNKHDLRGDARKVNRVPASRRG